jgi:prefoldin subunit 5
MVMQDTNQQLGRLEAQVESLQRQMEELRIDVKQMSDVITKWKGAGALLLILGASLGWLVDAIVKRL